MEDADANSFILKHVDTKRKQDQDVLSAEDFAWADSCLNADPDISETSMESVREALLNILDLHSEMIHEPSTNEQDNASHIDELENLPSFTDEGPSETAETSNNDHLEEEKIVDVLSSLKQQPFLPNYKDEMLKTQFSDDNDDDLGFVFSEFAMDQPLSDNIFKVWDLDIPVEEEDELDTQLKEALSSNAGTRVLPRRKGLDIESVDSLVESIADLSLK
uniref:uncharacterized protein LOC122600945 n=1 Tax=Erigeron canadensis TaxID=72917 RepID=UPI001CB922B8|nr:uncharacterized protein LOC122600945 [Erigeron canadensis]